LSPKRLRLTIGLFVAVFAGYVALSYRHGARTAPTQSGPPAIRPLDTKAEQQTTGGAHFEKYREGKMTFAIAFGSQLSYADGRTRLFDGVTVTLPDRNGRAVTINAREAHLKTPPDRELQTARFSGGVKLTTSDGVTITAAQATYDDRDGVARIPGPLTFTHGRTHGTGVGATYDHNRDVLWILDKARIDTAPDAQGSGAVHVTSHTAGFARPEHYMKFDGGSRLEGNGRIITADEATVRLTDDNERIQRMELRGNSHIAGQPGAAATQEMQARDIDLDYAEDGRALQTAHLAEHAAVQLPGPSGTGRRRVAAATIDVGLAPDGATVTKLVARDGVQVDLPPDGDAPARRIRSALLSATGDAARAAGEGGLQAATFTGGVDFRETRRATKKVAAVDRSAKAERLDVKTKPGFGDLQTATFRGNVHFTDGADTNAEAPVAVYEVASDQLDLQQPSPAGEVGSGPHVSNDRMQVEARTIRLTLTNQSMKADTNVRSVLQAKRAGSADAVKMPGLLKQGEPVNVKSNRLDYDGTASHATYSGGARLWQEDTVVQADRIVLDDKKGDLHATGSVKTVMTLKQAAADPEATGRPAAPSTAPTEPTTTVAEDLLYEDAKHVATYTTKAHMSGPDGDVTANKIELYLTDSGDELERAEAYAGTEEVVSRQETRLAYGNHLTYVAAKDEYTMVGKPVRIYDNTPPNCKLTKGSVLTFHRATDTIRSIGNHTTGQQTQSIACGTVK
jgi:lipopolysaccharide export system protein LptA